MVTTPIYLDYQATTPMDERVLDAMMPYLTSKFGNPHSSTHRFGWEAEAALDIAREQVAEVIGADAGEIYFTSGATEANNLALNGIMDVWGRKKPHLVTVVTEHKCVLEAAKAVERAGYRVTYLPVRPNGLIDLDQLAEAVTDETALVSVMAVNNEIGVIQPMADIGAICRAKGALFHTDAAQGFGKITLDVNAMNIDLMSISGHKIYGPKGVGALYKRSGRQTALTPQMSGGGQEGGIRSGTQAPALVAGLGAAASICKAEMAQEKDRLAHIMNRFKSKLFKELPSLLVNGDEEMRWAGNLNLSFPGLDGDLLLANIRSLAVSSGAACASAVSGPSYVLQAIGRTEALSKSALRIGIGRFTGDDEIDFAAETLISAVREMGGLKS
ncbi:MULTISPECIES: cysteine desulfurase family protein [Kordiimonas]|mgnify:CR=1 FL=1|jgi:cysteine desulfurase|uniref:cysteine desulfurase family protein n=1 Tax=Kordiimonas TaxID=288021 RepID=UPI00257BC8C5|nr:aminotransferase class V-fold PLP-dependent enzyme [Kordiimonas sp. UBA4487]